MASYKAVLRGCPLGVVPARIGASLYIASSCIFALPKQPKCGKLSLINFSNCTNTSQDFNALNSIFNFLTSNILTRAELFVGLIILLGYILQRKKWYECVGGFFKGVIGYLILSIPILLVEWIIGRFSPEKKDISSLRIIQAVFRFILKITGAKITVIGEENVPKDTPVLYIGNHRSYFDILLTYSRCPIRTGYIAKKEMEKIPLLSTWMRYLHCLFLDRKDIKQGLKTILTAVDKVKSGISICIFPEGTRNRNKDELDMLPFHEGSFKIATKANCPIIPIAISNSANIFEAHFPKISPAKVVVEYGKPIYPDELSKEDKRHVGEYTQNVIREMLIKNKPLTEN